MSSSFALFDKAKAKLQADLTPAELAALDAGGRRVRRNAQIGSILGAALAVFGMRRRKLWPLTQFPGRALFFIGGATVVGMQVGAVTGGVQALRTVQALPEEAQRRILQAMREVQVEQQDQMRRGGPLAQSRPWEQKSTTEQGGAMQGDAPATEADDGMRSEQAPYNGPGPSPVSPAANPGQTSPSVWQQIRGDQNGRPQTAWEKLRANRMPGNQTDTQKEADPFAEGQQQGASSARNMPQTNTRQNDAFVPQDDKIRSQTEFDRLLDRERAGLGIDMVDHAGQANKQPRRNKFGDLEV